MRSFAFRGFVALAIVTALASPAGAGAGSGSTPLGPDQRLDRRIQEARASWQRAGQGITLQNFRLVGHNDLGGFADFGDVYGHDDTAYVGSRCGDTREGGYGVQVVDISDASSPAVVSTLPNPRFTRAEDVVVLDVATSSFSGALAAVGIQICFGSGNEGKPRVGMGFFDVTDPAHPARLSMWLLPRGSVGCHEIDLVQRGDGEVLAGCARNLVDQGGGSVGVHFVDVTDPTTPQQVSTFSLGVDVGTGVGCFPVSFAHSVRFEDGGQTAYVSYWDAGTVLLDLSDPASPTRLADTVIVPPDEDGDNHSMTLANRGRWLVINPEDGSPLDCPGASEFGGFGEAYVYNNRDRTSPTFLGSFATDNTYSTRQDGVFDVHNTEAFRTRQFFSSWYSDGIVWWSMSNDGASHQLGQFVPPAGPLGPPLMWGVYVDRSNGLILGSDILTGLWIVRPVGAGPSG